MRTTILKRAWRAFVMAALLLATANLFAAETTVASWLSGGPNISLPGSGYVDGDITADAEYNTPCGLAMDLSGNYLLVADRGNNMIRVLEFDDNNTGTLLTFVGPNEVTNLFHNPIGVAIDGSYNIFVLNRGNGTNGNVLEFDNTGELIATNVANLANAAGMALDASDNIYLTIKSNTVLKVTSPGVSNVVATVTNAGVSLQGIVMKRSGLTAGLLAVCDSGRNGIYLINPTSGVVTTNAGFNGVGDIISTGSNNDPISRAKFYQPTGVAEAGDGSLIVSDFANDRVKVITTTSVTNLYGVNTNDWVYFNTPPWQYPGFVDGTVVVPDALGGVAARMPNGIVLSPDGKTVYVTEDYYHIIRTVTGANFMPPPTPPSQPTGLSATAGYGQVVLRWIASSGATNYNIKRALTSGGSYTNNTIGTATTNSYTDTSVVDGTTYYYEVSALSSGGESLNSSEVNATPLFSPVPTILSVTTNYGLVSLTWSVSAGATSYNLKRAQTTNGPFTTVANLATNGYGDTSVVNGKTYYYVVSALNPGGESANSSPPVTATVPLPPVPDPEIGKVDFPLGNFPFYTSVFTAIENSAVFNNDELIIVKGTPFSSTYYTTGNTTNQSDVPDPTTASASVPSDYADGLPNATFVAPYVVAQEAPYLTVKAMGAKSDGSPNSAVVSATFQFITGNPNIIGNNAAQFNISDITLNAHLYYTLDGSDPSSTNPAAVDLGVVAPMTNGIGSVTNVWTVSFPIQTNVMFKVRAFRDPNYQPSAIVTNIFYFTNFVPNRITFGFAAGEASSVFVASPGQTFYAPVTMTVLPGTGLDSLQFNVTVNSGGPQPGPAITAGTYGFQSMLVKPDPDNPGYVLVIPPYMYIGYATGSVPPSQIVPYENTNFVNLVITNISENMLGVGWLERQGQTNLFNTEAQNLLSMSLAHDDLFPGSAQPNGTIIGGYSFTVPVNAAPGDTFQIQIDRPSGTTDGIGNPGDSVFIFAPTNGSLGAGSLNALKIVTVGQCKYIAGDSSPFRWFNAGDFGNTNLDSSDVAQVFEAAVYGLNTPPAGTDLFDSMDSCGYTYVDNGYGYLQPSATLANTSLLFDGNDTTINNIAFGDGTLDVCDVYVTYRRSLQTNLVWFRRYWTNDVAHVVSGRVAEIVPNVYNPTAVAQPLSGFQASDSSSGVSITNQPKVNFVAGDYQTTAGSTIQIPITANVFGNYPLRVLMLNLSVVPLDGAPALTTPIAFSYNKALGSPWTTLQKGNGNYSVVWLNSTNTGLTGNASIGTLTVTIPTNATSLSAYAVHFDHASASPNGLGSFPKQVLTGLITLSSRTSSSYGDGIPDSWRLRYFGTVYNSLSVSNADADGTGMNNWQKYVAGLDPTDPASKFTAGLDQPMAQNRQDCVIDWPSVSGKQYVILRSPSLFPPSWIPVSTNSGNGTIMEYHDTSGGGVRYYRVQVK